LSSRADWRFRALRPIEPARLENLRMTRRYVDRPLDPLPFVESGADPPRLTLTGAEGGRSYLALTEPMPAAGWEVTVLLPTLPVERQALTLALAVVLALGLATMAVAVVLLRRARLRERLLSVAWPNVPPSSARWPRGSKARWPSAARPRNTCARHRRASCRPARWPRWARCRRP
ncbi:MAG: hypothetical protein MUE98_09785, partial [Rhodobacteraceae bacterium]|nr:hypothetical protein [Paracoccaceae bacterium]